MTLSVSMICITVDKTTHCGYSSAYMLVFVRGREYMLVARGSLLSNVTDDVMLVMRLSRVGRHNHAQYHIIVQEKTTAPTGKHLAVVGSYDPHSKQTVLQEEVIKKFLATGAQPSDTVYNLLVKNGLIDGKKRVVKLPAKKVEEQPTDAPAEAAAAADAPKDEPNDQSKNDAVKETPAEA